MDKIKVGDRVYHRMLKMHGVVVEPVGLGISEGFSLLVEFEDGETREVSSHLLSRGSL